MAHIPYPSVIRTSKLGHSSFRGHVILMEGPWVVHALFLPQGLKKACTLFWDETSRMSKNI